MQTKPLELLPRLRLALRRALVPNGAVLSPSESTQFGNPSSVVRAGWEQTVLDDILLPHVNSGMTVLEIGPGGGRWAQALQPLAARLLLVDVSERYIEVCRRRFANADNVEYFVNDGRRMPFIEDASVDLVWSFDVFVHLPPRETADYLAECARILRADGRAIIHHLVPDSELNGGRRTGTNVTAFADMVSVSGLSTVQAVRIPVADTRLDGARGQGHAVTTFTLPIASNREGS